MKEQEIICIVCPRGCHIKVNTDENGEYTFSGNQCNRGPVYVKTELTAPTRMLTTTIPIYNALLKRLPIASEAPLPKQKIFEAVKELKGFSVKAPIKAGDIVYENILGLGINMIAGLSLDRI